MASLKHYLGSSLDGILGGVSYVFPLCFTVLLEHL
jgi:hypothetical protein